MNINYGAIFAWNERRVRKVVGKMCATDGVLHTDTTHTYKHTHGLASSILQHVYGVVDVDVVVVGGGVNVAGSICPLFDVHFFYIICSIFSVENKLEFGPTSFTGLHSASSWNVYHAFLGFECTNHIALCTQPPHMMDRLQDKARTKKYDLI